MIKDKKIFTTRGEEKNSPICRSGRGIRLTLLFTLFAVFALALLTAPASTENAFITDLSAEEGRAVGLKAGTGSPLTAAEINTVLGWGYTFGLNVTVTSSKSFGCFYNASAMPVASSAYSTKGFRFGSVYYTAHKVLRAMPRLLSSNSAVLTMPYDDIKYDNDYATFSGISSAAELQKDASGYVYFDCHEHYTVPTGANYPTAASYKHMISTQRVYITRTGPVIGESYSDNGASFPKVPLSSCTFSATGSAVYSGTAMTSAALLSRLRVSYGNTVYTHGIDYLITGIWKDGVNYASNPSAMTEVGTYRIVIGVMQNGALSGVGTPSKEVDFQITAAPMSQITVGGISAQTYTGGQITPAVTAVLGSKVLVKDVDYTLSYGANVNPGTGTVLLLAKSGNFSGYKSVTFTINPALMSAVTMDAVSAATYTGSAITPTPAVTYGGKALTAGTDFTYSYASNLNSGNATVTINAKSGNFSGSKSATFKINPALMSAVTMDAVSETTYTGSAITPTPKVTYGGRTLTVGTDFTYSYASNLNAGNATVTVNAKIGNFSGGKSATFKINPAQMSAAAVASVSAATYTGSAITPTPAVTYGGRTLTAGTDFTYSYLSNSNAGEATVTINAKSGNFSGSHSMNFTINKRAQTFTVTGEAILECLTGRSQFTASGIFSTASSVWSSSNTSVLAVSSSGLVTARDRMGTAIIRLTNPGDSNHLERVFEFSVRVELTDGFYIGNPSDFAAHKVYATAAEAMDAVADGGTICVKGNPVLSSVLTVNKSIVFRGHDGSAALTRASGNTSSVFDVGAGGRLNIESLTVDGKNVFGSSIFTVGGELVLGSGANVVNGNSANGGAIYVSAGGSLSIEEGSSLVGNIASDNGGAVYISDDAASVSVNGGRVSNNRAENLCNGIYMNNKGISFDGTDATSSFTDSLGIAGGAQIKVTGGDVTHTVSVEFGAPDSQKADTYVISDDVTGARLKNYFRVVNSGFTFNGEEVRNALVMQESTTEVARFLDPSGELHIFYDLQKAVDAAAEYSSATAVVQILLVQYENDSDPDLNYREMELSEPLIIPKKSDGSASRIAFGSVLKHTDGTGGAYTYDDPVQPTVLKRGQNLTGAMLTVEDGAEVWTGEAALEGIDADRAFVIFDGGANFGGNYGVPALTDVDGGAGTAVTNNTGITAHAPVIVNRGTLNLGAGTTVRNNDNNYAKPGEGFGSQNYGGGLRNEGSGALNVYTGATVEKCYSREGGAVMNVNKPGTPGYAENGRAAVTIYGGTIKDNASQMKGAAIQTIYGGATTTVSAASASDISITNNRSLHDLGALSVEEGGALRLGSATVDAGGGSNAVYIYNKYGDDDYAEAQTKPFIEGISAPRFVLKGSPAITGAVSLDNPCIVHGTEKTFAPVIELDGLLTSGIEVTLEADRALGDAIASSSSPDFSRLDVKYPGGGDTEFSERYGYVLFDGSSYTLVYGGYDLAVGQTEPNKAEISGFGQTGVPVKVTVGAKEVILTPAADGKIAVTSVDLSLSDGCVFDFVTEIAYENGVAPFTETYVKGIKIIKLDRVGGIINAAEWSDGTDYKTYYTAEGGAIKLLSDGTLPNDIEINDGYAVFFIGSEDGEERVIKVGERELPVADPTLSDGRYVGLTDTSVILTGKQGYEYNLVGADGVLLSDDWKKETDGKVVFGGLSSDTEYTVVVRVPAGEETLPGVYASIDGSTFTSLAVEEAADKLDFETAFYAVKDGLYDETQTPPAEPTETAEDIKNAADKYAALTDTVMALAHIAGAKDLLDVSYDHALANEWKTAHEAILIKDISSVATADATDVRAALDAYDALTEGAKGLLDEEYADLTAKEELAAEKREAKEYLAEVFDEHATSAGEEIAESYSADGGIIDLASDAENAWLEAERAATAVKLEKTRESVTALVDSFVSDPNADGKKAALKEIIDGAAASLGEQNDRIAASGVAVTAAEDVYEMIAEYDREHFLSQNADILDKDTGLGESDIAAIDDALDSLERNYAVASQEVMNDLRDELLNKKKAALTDKLEKYKDGTSADGVVDGYIERIDAVDITGGAESDGTASEELDALAVKAGVAVDFERYKNRIISELEETRLPGDSDAVSDIITDAQGAVSDVVYDDDGIPPYDEQTAVLDGMKTECAADTLLQRQKDRAKEEFVECLLLVLDKSEDALNNADRERIAAAEESIDLAEDLPSADDALASAVKELLDSVLDKNDSEITAGIIADFKTSVDEVTAAAKNDGVITDVSAVLTTAASEISARREEERTAAKSELDERIADMGLSFSDNFESEARSVVEQAKQSIDGNYYAEYPLIADKTVAKLEILKSYEEIITEAEAQGYTELNEIIVAKNSAYDSIDTAADYDSVRVAVEDGRLGLDRAEGITELINYLTEEDTQAVRDVVTGEYGAADAIGSAGPDYIEMLVDQYKVSIDGTRFKEANPVFYKEFTDISGSDADALRFADAAFEKLPESVQMWLTEQASSSGYITYQSQIDDRIAKANYEAKKSGVTDYLRLLVRTHDGQKVRDTLEGVLETVEMYFNYEPCYDDESRGAYASELSEMLEYMRLSSEAQVRKAQKSQRVENTLTQDVEQRIESGCYSKAQQQLLRDILEDALTAMNDIREGEIPEEWAEALEILDTIMLDALKRLAESPVSKVVGEMPSDNDTSFVTADVTPASPLPGGSKLVIMEIAENPDVIISAINESGLTSVKGKEIVASMEIYLEKNGVKLVDDGEGYTVRLLLTPEMRAVSGLQVVAMDSSGLPKVLDVVFDGDYIIFDTERLTEFYILGEPVINLWWLIILLSVILTVELAVIFLLLTRKKTEAASSATASKKADFYAAAPLGLAAVIVPQSGITVCAVLGALVVAAAVVIALLLLRRSKTVAAPETVFEKSRNFAETAATQPEPVKKPSVSDGRAEKADKGKLKPAGNKIQQKPAAKAGAQATPKRKQEAPESPRAFRPTDKISAGEARSAMRDETAAALVEEKKTRSDKTKSAIINVEVLGKVFSSGDTVTLEEIKKRVPAIGKRVTYIKVLARGTLDKPLIVEADDFSIDAVKMILLTGGKAVRKEGSK